MLIVKINITNYYKGYPCRLGEVLGRIIGESESGSWGEIGGIQMYSTPLFATPGGTIIKTGLAYLSDLRQEDFEKLSGFEEYVTEISNFYGGKLTKEEVTPLLITN